MTVIAKQNTTIPAVPESEQLWLEKTLDEICFLRKELVEPSLSGSNRYVGLEHIDTGIPRIRRWGNDADLRSTKSRFYPGDVLYGKLRPYLDKAALAEWEGVCSTDILTLITRAEVADPGYLTLLLHLPAFINHAVATTAGVNHPRTSWAAISTFTHSFPPLPEQRVIAAVLSKIQAAVEIQEKIIAALKELKAATMAKLFRKGLRQESTARRETKFGQVPQAWKIEALNEHAYVQTGVAKGRKIDNSSAIELPYLRVANVQDGYLDLSEIKTIRLRETERERYSLQVDDVLLTEGGDFDKLGRGYLWKGQIENCVHQNHIFAVRTNRNVLLPEFFVYLVQSPYGKAYFLSVAHKTTNLACINSHKLKAFPILLPSMAEQQEIATIIAGIDQKIDQRTDKLKTLKHLFSSMLHLLMTGQVRVKGALI